MGADAYLQRRVSQPIQGEGHQFTLQEDQSASQFESAKNLQTQNWIKPKGYRIQSANIVHKRNNTLDRNVHLLDLHKLEEEQNILSQANSIGRQGLEDLEDY